MVDVPYCSWGIVVLAFLLNCGGIVIGGVGLALACLCCKNHYVPKFQLVMAGLQVSLCNPYTFGIEKLGTIDANADKKPITFKFVMYVSGYLLSIIWALLICKRGGKTPPPIFDPYDTSRKPEN